MKDAPDSSVAERSATAAVSRRSEGGSQPCQANLAVAQKLKLVAIDLSYVQVHYCTAESRDHEELLPAKSTRCGEPGSATRCFSAIEKSNLTKF